MDYGLYQYFSLEIYKYIIGEEVGDELDNIIVEILLLLCYGAVVPSEVFPSLSYC